MSSSKRRASTVRSKMYRVGYVLILLWPCLELASWIIGARPFRQISYEIVSTPSNCVVADSLLGFRLQPGGYQVQINGGLLYRTTHTRAGQRALQAISDTGAFPVGFFGCSYTYGMGVNDGETFASLVQQAIPSVEVTNYAVPGYGTVQGLLQLQSLMERGEAPRLAVFCYADFHNHRNAMSPYYQRDLRLGYLNSAESVRQEMQQSRFPFAARQQGSVGIRYAEWAEESFFQKLRRYSASTNEVLNIAERMRTEYLQLPKVSLAVFELIQKECVQNDVQLLVLGITPGASTQQLLHRLDSLQIATANVSVNLQDAAYNNLPFDSHPNDMAHKEMASKIGPIVAAYLAK